MVREQRGDPPLGRGGRRPFRYTTYMVVTYMVVTYMVENMTKENRRKGCWQPRVGDTSRVRPLWADPSVPGKKGSSLSL